MEFVSPEGLRVDGRRPQELRALQCKFGVLGACDGSALFQAGNTKACQCTCCASSTYMHTCFA